MSTSQRILDNAQYHSDLLRTQEELQYAPSALAQQTKYLDDLKNELQKVKANVARLAEITKKERKEHELLRDSTARRLAHKLAGKKEKFEAKREKEEREYVEALEKEMRERGNQTMLENMVKDAIQVKADLAEKTERLKLAKDEVAHLYEAIFDGYTPEFPRDDQLEQQMRTAQETYDRIQAQLNSNSQAVGLLQQADKMMDVALKNMDEALSYSTWDIYGRGTLADMMERNALSGAAMAAGKAEILIQQAQRSSSQVQSIGPLRVQDISLMGDVFFDNVFSDFQAQKKIQNNRDKLAKSHRRLKIELRAARSRSQTSGADLVEASEVLTECHQDLDRYRKETFQRISSSRGGVAGGSGAGDVLPSYEARSTTVLISAEGSIVDPAAVAPALASTSTPTPTNGSSGGENYHPAERVYQPPPGPPPDHVHVASSVSGVPSSGSRSPTPAVTTQVYQPPPGPPPGHPGLSAVSSSVSEPQLTLSVRMYQPPSGPPPGHVRSPTRGGSSKNSDRDGGSGSGTASGRYLSPVNIGSPVNTSPDKNLPTDKDLPTLPMPSQSLSHRSSSEKPGPYTPTSSTSSSGGPGVLNLLSHFRRASDSSVTVSSPSPSPSSQSYHNQMVYHHQSPRNSSSSLSVSVSRQNESGNSESVLSSGLGSASHVVPSTSYSHRRGSSVPVASSSTSSGSTSSLSVNKALPGPPSTNLMAGLDLSKGDTMFGGVNLNGVIRTDTDIGDLSSERSDDSAEHEHEKVPLHWGSRNPFAAMMMGGHGHGHGPHDVEKHSKTLV